MKKRMVYAVLLCTSMLLTACSEQNSDVSHTNNTAVTESMTDASAGTTSEGKTDDSTDFETESKGTTKTAVEPSFENTEETENVSEDKSSDSSTEQHNLDASNTNHGNYTKENKLTSPEQIIWEEEAAVPDKEDIMIPDPETQQNDTQTTTDALQKEEIPSVVTEKVIELPFVPAN